MKTTIKDNTLHIEIPLHAPRPSATGKPVIVGVNAYIKPVT